MTRLFRFALTAIAALALCRSTALAVDGPVVILLSAFPTEQAVLLAAASPVREADVFNGRRFFWGKIEGKNVLMGLTGIGLVNARATTQAALDYCAQNSIDVGAIVFSGVAGAGPDINIGDVMIPDRWSLGMNTYPVDGNMYLVAQGLVDHVTLDPCLPIEDLTCTGQRLGDTPICITGGDKIRAGGLGFSSDPYGPNAVPCLSSAGELVGCEACGAPLNTSPDVAKFVQDAIPFLNPLFFLGLISSFSGASPTDAVVVDMETAAVAALAANNAIPFLAFRAISDGGGDPLMLPGFPIQFFVYQQLAADNAAAAVLHFFKDWPGP